MEPYILGGHRYYRKISQKLSKRTTELARPQEGKMGEIFKTLTTWERCFQRRRSGLCCYPSPNLRFEEKDTDLRMTGTTHWCQKKTTHWGTNQKQQATTTANETPVQQHLHNDRDSYDPSIILLVVTHPCQCAYKQHTRKIYFHEKLCSNRDTREELFCTCRNHYKTWLKETENVGLLESPERNKNRFFTQRSDNHRSFLSFKDND